MPEPQLVQKPEPQPERKPEPQSAQKVEPISAPESIGGGPADAQFAITELDTSPEAEGEPEAEQELSKKEKRRAAKLEKAEAKLYFH